MKLKMTLDSLDGLDPALHSLYVKQEDGKFRLDIEGYQDPGALLRAKQHERDAHNATKARLAEMEAALRQMEEELESARRVKPKHGQEDALEQQRAAYEAKLAKIKEEHQKEKETLLGYLSKTYRDDVAMRIASELSDTPELLVPFIERRLQFELGASGPETRVLDAEGKLSASTVEELVAEFKANPKFAVVIRGSQANGGGAFNANGKGASGPKKPEEYTEKERVELFKSNRAEFDRLFGPQAQRVA